MTAVSVLIATVPAIRAQLIDEQLVAIGNPLPQGSLLPFSEGDYDVVAGGLGAAGVADQLQFGWQKRTGNFDQRVRLAGISAVDIWAEAGLMVRETLDPGSDFAAVFGTPSLAGVFFQARATAGSAIGARTGSFPVNHPQTWLRLQRNGTTITGYASYDGAVWTSLGSATLPLPDSVYFGIASGSHTTNATTRAKFRDLGNVVEARVVASQKAPVEPPGPTTRKTCFAISEIMFAPASREDGRDVRYVEIFNANPWPEDMSRYRLEGDFSYVFPERTVIAGGAFAVVAANPADLRATYDLPVVLGPCAVAGKVAGAIRLLNDQGAVYLDIPYLDFSPWADASKGTGHSLVLKRPSYGEGSVEAWGVSAVVGGSPGELDPWLPSPLHNVVINEFVAHSAIVGSEYVELYNHSPELVDISGCRLTDHPGTHPLVIPDGTRVGPGGFIALSFPLKPAGGSIYLESPDQREILDIVVYESQEKGVATGRIPDGGPGFHRVMPATPGAANGPALVDAVVINELMFKPLSGLKDDEFVELYNQSEGPVNLGGWQFTHGIGFTFPNGTMIPGGGYVVVSKNFRRLLTNAPGLSPANVLGDFSGSLSGHGDRVSLARPASFVTTGKKGGLETNQLPVIVDEVTYGAGGRWGHWSDGGGSSLELRDPRSNHQLASNWGDSDETAKAPWTTIENTDRLSLGKTQGGTPIDRLDVLMSGEGECVLDNVEVIQTDSGTNRLTLANSNFEGGLGNWSAGGDHVQTRVDSTGGVDDSQCLHIRATDRGDTGVNHLRVPLTRALTSGRSVTLRAQARWLRGFPELQLRVKGNYAEAYGILKTPPAGGTPGARNTQFTLNAGPAISDVTHFPPLPAAKQAVVVTARVDDPDRTQAVSLKYRIDPAATYTIIPMRDDGTGGDGVAGDGVYSATIPAQPAGTLVAFHISASDASATPATGSFPREAPTRECLVRFGEPVLVTGFGTYHLWLAQATVNRWTSLQSLSNERHDGTFIYGNSRVVYGVGGKFAGSPYHQGFGSPLNNSCHYSLEFPGDDVLLGATSFNKIHAPGNGPWEDDTIQREQTAYWMARRIGAPWNYRRYVNVLVNGGRRQPASLMEDAQTPDGDMVKEHFPDDADGDLYKLQPWFEFADDKVSFDNVSWCTLNNYVSDGVKKVLRYRPNFLVRAAGATANDYSSVFSLIDTAHLPASGASQQAKYYTAMESIIDTEEWLRIMAVEHAVGNWDSFLNSNGQNMYGYKPRNGRWTLFIWDYNIVLGLGNYTDGPSGDDLFKVTSGDNGAMNTFATRSKYLRALWRAYGELADGPMNSTNANSLIDARYAAFRTEGLAASLPTALKSWINSRHNYLVSQLRTANTPFAVTSPSEASSSTDQNPITLTGAAPVVVQDLEVNGAIVPVFWTDFRHWQARLPLGAAMNNLAIRGLDRFGNPVAGAQSELTVAYTGVLEPAAGKLVINEVMYHSVIPGAEFVELFNGSATTPYDLSGWRLDGLGYTFPPGATLLPGGFLVLAHERAIFRSAYGEGVPVFDTFDGFAETGGDRTLRLVQRTTVGRDDRVVCAVRFRETAPWPSAANGQGASLQLIDANQDTFRVANWTVATNAAGPLFTPGATNNVAASLPAFPSVWINEILPENTTAHVDNFGDRDPFIELYNTGPQSVDLSTSYLATTYGNLLEWAFPEGTTIPSREFITIWADGQPSQSAPGAPHTRFRLAAPGGSIALVSQPGSGAQPVLLDYIDYGTLPPGRSLGSFPDGPGLDRQRFSNVTPGSANDRSFADGAIFINEWMAANIATLANPVSGTPDDWFELFNAGESAIDLTGWTLTDDAGDTGKFKIPDGTSIATHGYLLIWADKRPESNTPGKPLHVNFKLQKQGSYLGLFTPIGAQVDSVTFGPQADDVSQGRLPDGFDGDMARFTWASPGAANAPLEFGARLDPVTSSLHLTWDARPGLRYRVVRRESLDSDWRLITEFMATTNGTEVIVPPTDGTQGFYRLVLSRF